MTLKINTDSIKRLDKKLKKKENAYAPKLSDKYDALKKEAKKQVKGLESGYRKKIKVSGRRATKNLTGNLSGSLDKYFKEIEKTALDSVKKELYKKAKTKEDKLAVVNARATKAVKGNRAWSKELAKKQVADYEKYINDSIKKAKELYPGITEKELKKLIDEKTESFKNVRVSTTARNEANRIQNQVRLEAYRESGLVRGIIFTAIMDDRTTDNCRSKDGTRLALDDPRINDYMIPQHINCRSYHVYILIDNKRTKLTPKATVTRRANKFKEITNKRPEGQPEYFSFEEAPGFIYFELLQEV